MLRERKILSGKVRGPDAKVILHPECRPEVIALADEVLSTGGMCRFAEQTEAKVIIPGTEVGIIHRLRKENPNRKFTAVSRKAVCPNVKKITLEKMLWALEAMASEVRVTEETRLRAKRAVDRILEIGRAN